MGRPMLRRAIGPLLLLSLLASGCGGGDDPADPGGAEVAGTPSASEADTQPTEPPATAEATPEPTATPAPATPTPAATATPTPTPAAVDDADALPPLDLLSYGAGAFPIRTADEASTRAAAVVLDGLEGHTAIERTEDPFTFVVELPAATVFETFQIPPMSSFGCCAGRHISTVLIEGSSTGPDDGFATLADFEIPAEPYDTPLDIAVDSTEPVRWVRVTLQGRQTPYENEVSPLNMTDIHGYGQQEVLDTVEGTYTGRWLTGGGGGGEDGNRIELIQDGALITGCGTSGGAAFTVTGGVENGIAKLRLGSDPLTTVAVINSEGQLSGATIGRSYPRIVGDAGGNPTDCTPGQADSQPSNPVGEALDAGEVAVVYGINFDVDSDELRPDAEPALNQILAALTERPDLAVDIEGHTDADGTDEYNLDLSQRRAESVVAWLTERGVDSSRLTPLGVGEAEPIAENDTAAGKAANRRVEVEATA